MSKDEAIEGGLEAKNHEEKMKKEDGRNGEIQKEERKEERKKGMFV